MTFKYKSSFNVFIWYLWLFHKIQIIPIHHVEKNLSQCAVGKWQLILYVQKPHFCAEAKYHPNPPKLQNLRQNIFVLTQINIFQSEQIATLDVFV